MITELCAHVGERMPHELFELHHRERLRKLEKMSKEYRRSINELRDFQKNTFERVTFALIQEILSELKKIAQPIFSSLTQLDTTYLAFRMQQMALMSEAILVISRVRPDQDKKTVSQEISEVLDELKIALLELGYDFNYLKASEQLNEKIEMLKREKLTQYVKLMRDYREEILRKKSILEELSEHVRRIEEKVRPEDDEDEEVFIQNTRTPFQGRASLPMTEVIAMLAHHKMYQD